VFTPVLPVLALILNQYTPVVRIGLWAQNLAALAP